MIAHTDARSPTLDVLGVEVAADRIVDLRAHEALRSIGIDPADAAADWQEIVAAGGRADVRAVPRVARLDYARAAEAGATVEATTWRVRDGPWSCRIADAEGADLLRARLAAGPIG